MSSLVERFTMPPHLAREVATGAKGLSDALLDMQREELATRLLEEDLIDSQGASLVRQGQLTADEAKLRRRLRAHKTNHGYTESRLDGFKGNNVVLVLLGGRLLRGLLSESAGFEFELETADETLTLPKHDLKLAFLAIHRKRLLKRGIVWGAPEAKLDPEALRRWANRRDIKASKLFVAMEEERVITWTTAEGDQVRGRITGFNRFEVILETTQGAEVILFRHAFGDMS